MASEYTFQSSYVGSSVTNKIVIVTKSIRLCNLTQLVLQRRVFRIFRGNRLP